jgi:hypothetical protein
LIFFWLVILSNILYVDRLVKSDTFHTSNQNLDLCKIILSKSLKTYMYCIWRVWQYQRGNQSVVLQGLKCCLSSILCQPKRYQDINSKVIAFGSFDDTNSTRAFKNKMNPIQQTNHSLGWSVTSIVPSIRWRDNQEWRTLDYLNFNLEGLGSSYF